VSATSRKTLDDRVGAGYEALARGAWPEAREQFEAALAREESPEAWEGLGWAGWWLSDEELTLRARERAYRLYRADGERGGAARVAAWLASDFAEFSGKETVGRGWLERARRLLEGAPEGPDHGWLAVHEGHFALGIGDPEGAGRLGGAAARLGRDFRVPDLEAVGLALEGTALVGQGRVEDGMRRLDEASVIAAGEDLELPACAAWSLCYLISACANVGDLPRAEHWCEAMRAWVERWGSRSFLGVCRVSYGRLLSTQGRWDVAESELVAAVEDLEVSRPGMAASGFVRLAELRLRQGRVDEARALLERAVPSTSALVALGEVALQEGDAAAARDAAERVLRRLPEGSILDRLSALELLARAEIAAGDLAAAGAAVEELDENAATLGTPYLLGRAHVVAGELAAARGDLDRARRHCEDAVDRLSESSAPYEAAVARLVLARVLGGLGRAEAAEAEASAALAVFTSLGASRDAARAQALIGGEGGEGSPKPSLGDLTPRELDVLRLVAQGLSDAEIAERLVVSPHTVHRHVANVRAKLRLPSRAAAVAYAARAGLL
jgi:ATP/maltotriose-dependent transcriptional regulator MalT